MEYENNPQEITADEKRLGFELLVLEAYGFPWQTIPPLSDVPVVMKRMSPFDIIVKSKLDSVFIYVHKRYGKDGARKKLDEVRPEWWPMAEPTTDASTAIARCQSGHINAPYAKDIISVEYKTRAA